MKNLKFLKIFFLFLLSFFVLKSQEVIWNEKITKNFKIGDKLKRYFSVNSLNNVSLISLKINGYDVIEYNILPVVKITVNDNEVFSGTMSDYSFGKNQKYGTIEFNIKNYVKIGSNLLKIEFIGLPAQSYIYLKNMSILLKRKGSYFKTLSDFNYNSQNYTQYLKQNLTIGSTVIATEDYQKVKKGMYGVYYGEVIYNTKFCYIKWSKNLNTNLLNLPDVYPKKYKSNAFIVPYSKIKILKTKSFDDNSPPKIYSTQNRYIKTSDRKINISGRVSDKNGIYAVFVNNIKAQLDNQKFYNIEIPLKKGKNYVKLYAFDNLGYLKYEKLIIIRQLYGANPPPQLDIDYPNKNKISVIKNSVQFSGKVTNNDYITNLTAVVNKKVYKIYVGKNNDFKVDFTIVKGQNNIELFAIDETGKESKHYKFLVSFEPEKAKAEISVVNPKGITSQNKLTIDKNIKDLYLEIEVSAQNELREVDVTFLNGPITIPLKNLTKNKYAKTIQLPSSDLIAVKIEAIDIYGNKTPYSFLLERTETIDPFPNIDNKVPFTNRKCDSCYALIIGNAQYDKEKSLYTSLPYSLNDAVIFEKYLIQTYGVNSDNIQLVKNAGSIDLLNSITAFIEKIDKYKNSRFLFYYSGHGAMKNGNPFLLPIDYNQKNDDIGLAKNLTIDTIIYKMMLKSPKKLTVILDMCFSGKKDAKGIDFGNNSFDISGPVVVLSASKTEAYPFKRRNHSIFTYALLKSLYDYKGEITYGELQNIVQKNIDNIIEHENFLFDQKCDIQPSSILDDNWKNWTLP